MEDLRTVPGKRPQVDGLPVQGSQLRSVPRQGHGADAGGRAGGRIHEAVSGVLPRTPQMDRTMKAMCEKCGAKVTLGMERHRAECVCGAVYEWSDLRRFVAKTSRVAETRQPAIVKPARSARSSGTLLAHVRQNDRTAQRVEDADREADKERHRRRRPADL